MTHEYIILLNGRILPGGGRPQATAIAWAHGTVLALGTDAAVRAISRGDSRFIDLAGAWVVPLDRGEVRLPGDGTLQVGDPADLAVFRDDPRGPAAGTATAPAAVIRHGQLVSGSLPFRR